VYLGVIPLLALLLWFERRWYRLTLNHYLARLLLAVIGFATDSLLQLIQLIQFDAPSTQGAMILAPFWLFLMWVWFAFTLASCYQWLMDKPVIAIIFAALLGPLAYWGASQISPVFIIEPYGFTLLSFLFWGTMFAVIFTVTPIKRLLVPQAAPTRGVEVFQST